MLIQTIWPECWFSHLTFCTASQQHGSCCLHSLSFFLHLEIVISWLIARHSMSNCVEPFCSEILLLCQSYISFLALDVGHSYLSSFIDYLSDCNFFDLHLVSLYLNSNLWASLCSKLLFYHCFIMLLYNPVSDSCIFSGQNNWFCFVFLILTIVSMWVFMCLINFIKTSERH